MYSERDVVTGSAAEVEDGLMTAEDSSHCSGNTCGYISVTVV